MLMEESNKLTQIERGRSRVAKDLKFRLATANMIAQSCLVQRMSEVSKVQTWISKRARRKQAQTAYV